MNTSFVFLAPGFEEIEALTPVDVMRRANIDVKTVAIDDSLVVEGAHGVGLKADLYFSECDFAEADWLILPGGLPGASNLAAFSPLTELLKFHHSKNGRIAAICASPGVVLGPLGILEGKRATAYPGFEGGMKGATPVAERVVVDGNVITANGPSSAMAFALAIVEADRGKDTAHEVASGMLCD